MSLNQTAQKINLLNVKDLKLEKNNDTAKDNQAVAETKSALLAKRKKLPGIIVVFKQLKSTGETTLVSMKECGITPDHPQFIQRINNTDYCRLRSAHVL